MKSFPKIKEVELYLCGGYVRDHILNKIAHDRDFVAITKLSFNELVKAVETAGGKVFQAKEEFLTIRCRFGKEAIDIALPRSENNYTDNRHPDEVTRVDTLKEDASRRDFTINAMYMNEQGEITDFFEGKEDLEGGLIKCVGAPDERFKEDALRILRAARFAIKYDFNIEPETRHAMIRNKNTLSTISQERIRDELNKCLLLKQKRTTEVLSEIGLWDLLINKGLWLKLTSEKVPHGI